MGDFNSAMINTYLEEFFISHNLDNLIKEPTCYGSPETCSNHILTNHTKSFHLSDDVYKTGLSDFLYSTLTVFQAKYKPKIIQHINFNHFDNA